MSSWKIAAAQYSSPHNNATEHIAHHLRFIHTAAQQQSEVLVFPELSLSGPATASHSLPAPPDDELLQPLAQASLRHKMTVIAGLPVEQDGVWRKGIIAFFPWRNKPFRLCPGHGICLAQHVQNFSICGKEEQGIDMSPEFSLLVTGKRIPEPHWHESTARLQRFSHKYAIAVLLANSCGSSAFWDESGQLIIRADPGTLLITVQYDGLFWQGDIIPLR